MASPGDLAGVLSCTPLTATSWKAQPGEYVRTDATHGNITVTLPASPPMHSVIGVKQLAASGSYVTTVACSGADAFNKPGGTTSLTLTLPEQGTTFTYKSGAWLITAGDLPLSQLDLRYAPAVGAPAATAYAAGYAGWTQDYATAPALTPPGTTTWAAGTGYFQQIPVVPGLTVNGYISFYWQNAAAMAGSYLSVYTVSGGVVTLVGSTSDLSLTTTGYHRVGVSYFTATPASGVLYVGYLNGTSGVAGGPCYVPGAWAAAPPSAGVLPPGGLTRFVQHAGPYATPPASYALAGSPVMGTTFWCALD